MTSNDVLEVNQAFYDAFAEGDYAVVEKLWARGDKVSVIHPGSTVLHGRKDVMKSWKEILKILLVARSVVSIQKHISWVTQPT